ncbi:MAG: BrnT family toxin [Candidatus Competibacteraceae bacterium]|nr:BrnT family toxin [Candidatus Competibacteraceae bacterium]HRX71463.1 BrnT family toxin [Candidatus Competibacteraceae bacterium]
MLFEWDADKARRNQRKHKVSFETAARVFLDPNRIETYDDRENYGEDRWKTVGLVEVEWLTVVYTLRGDHETIRIISARRADESEKRTYRQFRT